VSPAASSDLGLSRHPRGEYGSTARGCRTDTGRTHCDGPTKAQQFGDLGECSRAGPQGQSCEHRKGEPYLDSVAGLRDGSERKVKEVRRSRATLCGASFFVLGPVCDLNGQLTFSGVLSGALALKCRPL
jgi:hypothetical protein